MAKLVLLGAGHAHLMLLAALDGIAARGHEATVVSPAGHHYYSGMGPGLLAGMYEPGEVRFAVRRMVERRSCRFVRDRAVRIDAQRRVVVLLSGATLAYDVLSCNVGSRVHVPDGAPGESVLPVKPIERLLAARERLRVLARDAAPRVVIAGGGPAAVELAGCAWRCCRDAGREAAITMLAGTRFMHRVPEAVRRRCRASLEGRGVRIVPERVGAMAEEGGGCIFTTPSGAVHAADLGFVATGIHPSPLFRDSGLPVGGDGGLAVNQWLQCVDHPEIFGGGDCIHFSPGPLDKIGVHAVRQNPVLLHNVSAALEGRAPARFVPQEKALLILNLGDGSGVLHRGALVLGGRAAFWLKDVIDRRFMKRYRDRAGTLPAGTGRSAP